MNLSTKSFIGFSISILSLFILMFVGVKVITAAPVSRSVTVTVTAAGQVPTVINPTVANLTSTGVRIGATLSSQGTPAPVSAYGVCYIASAAPVNPFFGTQGVTCIPASTRTTAGVFTVNISGLSPNTAYKFRGYATNPTGVGYTSANTLFTTPSNPVMSGTLSPSSSTCTIASGASYCPFPLSWSIVNPEATPTAITSAGMSSNVNVTSTRATPQSGTQGVTARHGSWTYFLYNNEKILGTPVSATANCVAGTSWISGRCTPTPVTYRASTTTITDDGASAPSAGGRISPTEAIVNGGSTATFTITKNPGYSYLISGCNGRITGYPSTSSITYVTGAMNANCTVTAQFWGDSSLVTTSAGSGGGISPGTRPVAYGRTTTFTITPNSGYAIASVSGCGGSLSGNTYTTGPITSSCTVSATFSHAGVCSISHYGCNLGTSINNVRNTSTYNWSCTGVNGGATTACSETINSMTGSLTPASSSCIIPNNASSCNVNLTWSTTNPVGTSAITSSYPSPNTILATGNSGSNRPIAVPYLSSPRAFYLSNNGVELASASATSSCISGTTWNNGRCETTTPLSMQGTLTGSNCEITEGNSSCSVRLNRSITNPVGTPTAITANGMNDINVTNTRTTPQSGTRSVSISLGPKTFYLYNNGDLLSQVDVNATTVNTDPVDGGWRDTSCTECDSTGHQLCTRVCDSPSPANGGADCPGGTTYSPSCNLGGGGGNGLLNIEFAASPDKIFKGKSSNLTWTSTADSCTVSTPENPNIFTGAGDSAEAVVVNPAKTTTYTLTCTSGATEETAVKDEKVSSITVIER